MIGNMVGQVTEDTTMQIIPQAAAHPVRPSLTPLTGAVITDCQPNGPNGYILTYTKDGQTYKVDYNWTANGKYTFNFISPTGTTTEIHNGFVQCQVPVGVDDLYTFQNSVSIYPNPTRESFSVLLSDPTIQNDIQHIDIYSIKGDLVSTVKGYKQTVPVRQLASGVYLVKVRFAKSEVIKKLIVE
jgi:hypothetical protein